MQKIKKITNFISVAVIASSLIFPLIGNVGHAKAEGGATPGYVSNFEVEYQPGPDVIHVSWGLPTDIGDSGIIGYKISWSYNQADDYSSPISTTDTHYDLSTSDGLTKDRRYDIRVWAINSDGNGLEDMIPWVLYGTQVYNITNCQELQNINNDLWGDYTLENDINCAETDGWTNGFEPIGGSTFGSDGFHGNFDGRGYTISDLFMDADGEQFTGMFGAVSSQDHHVDVKNFTLYGCQIHGGSFAGAVAGAAFGDVKLSDISTNCQVIGNNGLAPEGPFMGVGGIVGGMFGGDSANPIATRTSSAGVVAAGISGDGEFNVAGGLVGSLMDASTLTDSYSSAHIIGGTGSMYVAGAVGVAFTYSSGPIPVIKNIYATGTVTYQEGNLPGGLIALVSSADVENSFVSNTLTLSGGDSMPGDLISEVSTNVFDNVIKNNFVDGFGADIGLCLGGDPSPDDECTIVNDDVTPDANYFKGNKVDEPMHSWDFDTIWQTVDNDFPELNYRPVTDDGGSGSSGGSSQTVKNIKKKLSSAKFSLPSITTSQISAPKKLKLNDFDDYFESAGHQIDGLMIGQVIDFDIIVNGATEHHTITVKDIGDGYVVLTIASTPFDVRIELGKPQTITINGQKIMDINLVSTVGGAASLTFAKYKQPVVATIQEARQVSTSKNSTDLANIIAGAIAAVMAVVAIVFATRHHRKLQHQ